MNQMLTDEEKREIEEELAQYEVRRAASIEALKVVQRQRGWVSDDAIKGIAEIIGMSPEELDSVATFYTMIFRRPVGRHVILVCESVSCWILGGETIKDYLSRLLRIGMGETTLDNRFTLLPAVCLGCCDRGPAMMVDEDLHLELTPDKIGQILERYK